MLASLIRKNTEYNNILAYLEKEKLKLELESDLDFNSLMKSSEEYYKLLYINTNALKVDIANNLLKITVTQDLIRSGILTDFSQINSFIKDIDEMDD